uniref:Uncharacterized protein n=1 Tax=Anguilla anguilla TaxID=7936 RepID=A0A0E9QAL6_ANGAN
MLGTMAHINQAIAVMFLPYCESLWISE